ncbi:CHAP domain-containing protein [Croceimicrobium hydrocarbonivorans]|uniref:CHAP domain-containing protein n=1 Tax=Croceimicrobium hydrocarbonivorans TaxID=2761580 RepID=A0A7H0VHU1_9FLAO|nr:CHAP domain-containing protein [Croceimicrobium hydrocarbonivorans]QNR25289.1 CHAP domain-containing protein [Croceimicrobium hydrocarbonivorans]
MKKKHLLYAILIIVVPLGLFGFWMKTGQPNLNDHEIGDEIDRLNGVAVYYNGAVSHVDGRNLTADGYNLGLKWQCVEFVKRYYYEHLNHKMPDSYGHAKSFYSAQIGDGQKNAQRNLIQYRNPSQWKPAVNDLLVYDGTLWNPYGHVAIVSAVFEDEIEIIQQNPGPTALSRLRIGLSQMENKYHLEGSTILGWLRKKAP